MRRLGLGAAGGSIPSAPAGFQYPTQETFVAGLTGALGDIDEGWAADNLSKPVAAAVPVVKTAVSAAGNADFAAIASAARSGKLGASEIAAISSALSALVQGALTIAQQLADTSKAAQSVANAADAIPVIGGIIQWVVDLALGIAGSSALTGQAENAAENELHQQLADMCGDWAAADQPYGPGSALTPADIFRKVGFRYQTWVTGGRGRAPRLPLNASSMYVMLCGGETQGFGLDRQRYDQLVAKARARNPKVKGGIPREVQRKMWGLIKGIMANVEPPIAGPPVGDQGRMLMAVLQDVSREYYLRATKGPGPGWDDYLARLLSDEITRDYHQSVTKRVGASVIQRSSTCAGQEHGYSRHLDLSQALIDSVAKYEQALLDQFWDPAKQAWSVAPRDKVMTQKTGELVLSVKGSEHVAGEIERATGAKKSRLVVGALSLLSAGGGYWLARGGYDRILRAVK